MTAQGSGKGVQKVLIVVYYEDILHATSGHRDRNNDRVGRKNSGVRPWLSVPAVFGSMSAIFRAPLNMRLIMTATLLLMAFHEQRETDR